MTRMLPRLGSLLVAVIALCALGLPALAQLQTPAPASVHGGYPSQGQTFIAGVFNITNAQTPSASLHVIVDNSIGTTAAQGSDITRIRVWARNTPGPCTGTDFTVNAPFLAAGAWTLLGSESNPAALASFHTTGVQIHANLAFLPGQTFCIAIQIDVAATAVIGREFQIGLVAVYQPNTPPAAPIQQTSRVQAAFKSTIIEKGISAATALRPVDVATGLELLARGATNQVLQILRFEDTERGTGGTVENLDPDTGSNTITSLTVHNANAPTPKGVGADLTALKLYVRTGVGPGDCPGPTAGGNPPVGATLVPGATLTGAALDNFHTTGATFTGLGIPVPDEALLGNGTAVCVYVVADIAATATVGNQIQVASKGTSTGEANALVPTDDSDVQATTLQVIAGAAKVGCDILQTLDPGVPILEEVATIEAGTIGVDTTNGLVEVFNCGDLDVGTNDITAITSITIANLGTSVAGADVTRIAVYDCGNDDSCAGDINAGKRVGLATVTSFPVTIPLTGLAGPADGGPTPSFRTIGIVVDVAGGATVGSTIRPRVTNIQGTEGGTPFTNVGPVDDLTDTTIIGGMNKGCDIVLDLNQNSGTIAAGALVLVQRFACVDSDPDTNSVQITHVTVTNLGTGTVDLIEVRGFAPDGSLTVFGSATAFGVPIPVPMHVPDSGNVEFQIWVRATSGTGTTIRPRTTLRHFEGGFGPFNKFADDGSPETVGTVTPPPPPPPPPGGCNNVTVTTRPASVRFSNPNQQRTIRVTVINRSGAPITVEDITEVAGQQIAVAAVRPLPPVIVRNNRSRTFYVTVDPDDAATYPLTVSQPYFEVTMDCGLATASAPLVPLAVESVQAKANSRVITLRATGQGIASIELQLFDMGGQRVLTAEGAGSLLVAEARSTSGRPLAKGVYLYVVTVKGWDGTEIRSEVRKLVVR